jgi:hypothetical protein
MTNVTALKHDGYERRLIALRDGVRSAWPQGLALQILQGSVGPAEADQRLSDALVLFQDVHDAELALRQKRMLLDAALPAAHTFSSALERGLAAWFSVGDPRRAQFGLSLGLRRPMTGEAKAIAHGKALVTRRRRFTMGRRQREALSPRSTVQILGPDGKVIGPPGGADAAPKIVLR